MALFGCVSRKEGGLQVKRTLTDAAFIVAGSFLLALGVNLFLVPGRLSSGGIGSVATVLLYLFRVPLSLTNALVNGVLFLFGYRLLDKAVIIKTVAGILCLSIFLEITAYMPVYRGEDIIASVVGGILVGVGVGLVVRRGASTGGSDFVSLMVKNFVPHISAATVILMIDSVIVLLAGIVFGSVRVTFYSALSLYISSKLADKILSVGYAAKSVYILSHQNQEIAAMILREFERGVTGVYSRGIYSATDTLMLLCIVSPREAPMLARAVRDIDERAFIMIEDVREVLGEGFRAQDSYH